MFKVLSSLVVALWLPATASAELYKYVNEDGVTVLDSHVPARYVKNGYTILSLDGRVLEVVPRALTEQEIRQRDAELAQQKRLEEERRQRQIADQNLLRLYGRPEDVVRARDTKIASIQSFISAARGNIERLEEQQRSIEGALADVERSGGTISKNSLDRIRSIESRIRQIQDEIESKQDEMVQLRDSYAADLERVKELYGQNDG
jgi:chromosome segregation ATPase